MESRTGWTGIATLVVALLILGIAVVLLLRPATGSGSGGGRDLAPLEGEIEAVRSDIADLRAIVEESGGGAGRPVDLSAVEGRLGGLEDRLTGVEQSIASMSASIDAMNATARAICQMVADSPFTPTGTC